MLHIFRVGGMGMPRCIQLLGRLKTYRKIAFKKIYLEDNP